MKIDKPVMAVIAILVSVLIVATVAVPIVEDAQSEIKSIEQNTDNVYFAKEKNGETIVMDYSGGSFKVNGFTVSTGILGLSDNMFISTGSNGIHVFLTDGNNVLFCSNVTISNNEVKCTSSSEVKTLQTTGPLYYISEAGSFGLFKNPFFLNKNGDIVSGQGVNCTDSTGEFKATVQPLIKYSSGVITSSICDISITKNGMKQTVTSSDLDVKINLQESEDKLSNKILGYNITVRASIEGVSDPVIFTANDTFIYTFAPIDYLKVTESDKSVINLLSVIPILLFLVPVFIAVAALKGRSD